MNNERYILSMKKHNALLKAFPPELILAVIQDLESGAVMGDFEEALDNLRSIVWDDAKAAVIWSAALAALGSDLESRRQAGQIPTRVEMPEEGDDEEID